MNSRRRTGCLAARVRDIMPGVRRARRLSLLSIPWMLLACDARMTAPPAPRAPSFARSADQGTLAVTAWNAIARELVSAYSSSPPAASRTYALLSLAQHDALVTIVTQGSAAQVRAHSRSDARVAVAYASARVLGAVYPAELAWLEAHAATANTNVEHPKAGAPAAATIALARSAADAVLSYAESDGSDAVWDGTVPVGPGLWFSSLVPARPPLLPRWGEVRPWFLASGSAFRPDPPPAFGSPAFLASVAEVRHYAETRTPEQQHIAEFWADGPGTPTPPGHWNAIASEMIEAHRLDELSAARVLAYMNMAVMDAGIACWDAKFAYWLMRPSQVDPSISLAVGLPNFPAYTSGHSAFSGAASTVLAWFFPGERRTLDAMAEEAAMSRVFGGIHYRFDSDVGLRQGRAVGELAIRAAERRGRSPGGR